jgi:Na+-translocating ferredoxin:NAD+ oxidoreductase RnfD subunit
MRKKKTGREKFDGIGLPAIPPISDPRYLQLAVLAAYAITAREVFHFERSHWTTLYCCSLSVCLDLLIGRFYYRKLVFPLSALIIGLASSLLIDARSPLPYLAVVSLASLSKAFIKGGGRHFFNPANFGVVLVLQLLPGDATGMPALFAGYLAPAIVFAVLGLATSAYARQLEVSLSWLGGFLVFGSLRAWLSSSPLAYVLAPVLSPAVLLFTFHMISDPATTPRTRKFRILFGSGVALLDSAMRYAQIPNAPFYSLFLVSCLLPWIRAREEAGEPLVEKARTSGKARAIAATVWIGLFIFSELAHSKPLRGLGWPTLAQWLPPFRYGHVQYDSILKKIHVHYYVSPSDPARLERLWDLVKTPAWGWKEGNLDIQALLNPRYLLHLCAENPETIGSFRIREYLLGENTRYDDWKEREEPCSRAR